MIHFVSLGGKSIARALQSLLSCYGKKWQSYEVNALAEWQIDTLIADPQIQIVFTECNPIVMAGYFAQLPIKIQSLSYWWQVLPPSASQWQKIVTSLKSIDANCVRLNHTFLLSHEYDPQIWVDLIKRIQPQIISSIASMGSITTFPDINLDKLSYTAGNGLKNCLVFPRSDRLTNQKVFQLLSIVVERVPLYTLTNVIDPIAFQ